MKTNNNNTLKGDHHVEATTANETTETESTWEERYKKKYADALQGELWRIDDYHDSRHFKLPDRAQSHLLKYGQLGREIMLRGNLKNERSVQVYFGFRRALVARFWTSSRPIVGDPTGSWELLEYRWKSEWGREMVRRNIDRYIDLLESGERTTYIDTFFIDVERPFSDSDIA
jgi:hypothetical protein